MPDLTSDVKELRQEVVTLGKQVAAHTEQLKNGKEFREKLDGAGKLLAELTPKVSENRRRLIDVEKTMGEVEKAAIETNAAVKVINDTMATMAEDVKQLRKSAASDSDDDDAGDGAARWDRFLTFLQSPIGVILALAVLSAMGFIKSESDKAAYLEAVQTQHALETKAIESSPTVDETHETPDP